MSELSGNDLKLIRELENGPLHWFANWPTGNVPKQGAIVYTVWDHKERLIYVGMSGRNQSGPTSISGRGPWGRLNSHASGRRSGDQFCVYVCDRFVLIRLQNRIADIADGSLSLDAETRQFIKDELGFRWVEAESGKHALAVEKAIQRGVLSAGKPTLNPSPTPPTSPP